MRMTACIEASDTQSPYTEDGATRADYTAGAGWTRTRWEMGGAEGTRTPDPLDANEVRYQLRYSPKSAWAARQGAVREGIRQWTGAARPKSPLTPLRRPRPPTESGAQLARRSRASSKSASL